MTDVADADLQTLRRRAEATGAPDDRAALLRARVRVGELALERVELAAYCGDEAARAVCGPVEAQGWANPGALSLDVWLRGLSRWSDLYPRAPGCVLRRAAFAAVEAWEKSVGGRGRDAGAEIRRLDLHHRMWADPSRLWDSSRFDMARATVAEAAREIGEQPVREAICRSLSSWALLQSI